MDITDLIKLALTSKEDMMVAYISNRYYADDKQDAVSEKLKGRLGIDTKVVRHEFLTYAYDLLNKTPCHYFDDSVFAQVYSKLTGLVSKGTTITIDAEILNYFIDGCSAYFQIADLVKDLDIINENTEVKNRLYRVPAYTSIVEGSLSNLFRFILLLLNQTSNRDYYNLAIEKTLSPICEALRSNGFNSMVDAVDINIRNAINHGGVFFKNDGNKTICFRYKENNQLRIMEVPSYELDKKIYSVFDTTGGVILALICFLNDQYSSISIDRSKDDYVSLRLFALELSTPSLRCQNVWGLDDKKQINFDFYTTNTARDYIFQTAVELAIIGISRFPDYQQYMFSFNNERMITNWLRFTHDEIKEMISTKKFDAAVKSVIARKDYMVWDASNEEIDVEEVKHFRFPRYNYDGLTINRIADASVAERKRIKANMFIGDETDKAKILSLIERAIEWLKHLKNPASLELPYDMHKHGEMDADSLYINVYRRNLRKEKEIYISNENFVCFVDYNIDGKTTLVNGGVFASLWKQYHHERVGNSAIAWREAKYALRIADSKVGRNDPCPCGSGKKYKKCCFMKE